MDRMFRTEAANAQFNMNNQFNFKNGWSGELSGFCNSKRCGGPVYDKTFWTSIRRYSKSLLKNKATIKLNVRDIFYTQVIYGAIEYQT